jgi:hypothetical protein
VCGVVNGINWFAVCAASVMSVPPWPSAAGLKPSSHVVAENLPRSRYPTFGAPLESAYSSSSLIVGST